MKWTVLNYLATRYRKLDSIIVQDEERLKLARDGVIKIGNRRGQIYVWQWSKIDCEVLEELELETPLVKGGGLFVFELYTKPNTLCKSGRKTIERARHFGRRFSG